MREQTGVFTNTSRRFQYLSIRCTEPLVDASIESSVASQGDSYGNALAAPVVSLLMTEVVCRRVQWKIVEYVAFAISKWVWWVEPPPLLGLIGFPTPVKDDEADYREQKPRLSVLVLHWTGFRRPQAVHPLVPLLITVHSLQPRFPAVEELNERFGLTPRQGEVALLLAQGKSTRQIADELVISWHTARRHVENVMRKLNIHARAEVARVILSEQ